MTLVSQMRLQAQGTAFEHYYPFYSPYSMASNHCVKETPDGGYIVYMGMDDGMLYKLSGTGEIINQKLFDFGEHGITNQETYIVELLDKPNDPEHWMVFASTWDTDLYTSSSVFLFDIDQNLGHEPENVKRIDFPTEEIQLWNSTYPPRIIMEEDGSISGASYAQKWDYNHTLMLFRISPDGNISIGFDDRFRQVFPADWIPFEDGYRMILTNNSNLSSVYYELSPDFANIDTVYTLITNVFIENSLLYYTSAAPDMDHDTIVAARVNADCYSPLTFLSDSVMILPTSLTVFREYHNGFGFRQGVGLWKLDHNFNDIGHTAVCRFTNDHLEKYLYSSHPLLLGDGELYLCYNEKSQPGYQLPSHTVVCKFDTDLNLIWQRWYGRGGYAKITECSLTSDGGCILIGEGRDNGSYCPYVVKITPEGYSAIDEEADLELRPYAFYPNPVGDILHMEFSPDVKPVQVELYDLQGRLLRTQSSSFESINMDNLPSGTYTLRVTLENGMSYGDKVVKQ